MIVLITYMIIVHGMIETGVRVLNELDLNTN